jgi:membrane fusion protein (multidrug efflux system)
VGVNSRTAGTILSVRVIEGDRVRPGQVMAELDARETAAQLDRVRAVLANAERAFRRAEQMRASQILTDAEFEQARAAFVMAQSDVELWAARLEFSRVLAPTAGTVTAKHIEAGTAVSVNQRLFDIADDSLLVVRVQMSELDVVRIAPGDSVAVQLDALDGVTFPARVRRVFPSADPATRLVPVEVALGRAPNRIVVRPGFLARVRFGVDRRAGALVVPASAVGAGTAGSFVYIVDADTLVRRAVTTGLTSGDQVEITSGLDGGERIVTSGHLNLRPGARVRVTRDDAVMVDTLALRAGASR